MRRYIVVLMGVACVLYAGHIIGLHRLPAEPQADHNTIIPVEIDVLTATIRIVAHPRGNASVLQLHEVLDVAEQDWLDRNPGLHICKRVTLIQPQSLERCIWVQQRTPEKPKAKEVARHDMKA
ncbi:MAG: hypothetical protein PeribacterA2_0750 [Candidatus Peribacter riflensis]|uniref:Uncharacterized protein n=1 Tax=Candidatus Peribacter riflensis TaxID=1735162 RepID=A0A0S1SK96_9BACT|nr:MAG: hypothetical protein PeribacterA2_0750 [Candidatus Peribacter riflensis]ALM11217.1 MAG: hypothetical protein PeribacterB2_0751 [Candidatus Peribacter riflensis]ALM12320.1 MAG: hypothetical protein PeribacterC2_0751 [Candidatus Peribacter riflensis]ALM13422.1 MAG: hypothetical protein PeribacterD1_0751 [Candidatus Peribacter riflensis]ALM14521.1 MAG: hypothetical protein PeribacterD2_0749 [Candidatus Peribacter riflensis]